MKTGLLSMITLLLLFSCGGKNDGGKLKSPDGKIKVDVNVDNKMVYYSITYGDLEVINKSPLGIKTSDQDLTSGITVDEISDIRTITKTYKLFNGKKSNVRYICNEQEFTFENSNGAKFTVIFRASNDGVAYRYRLYGTGKEKILSENTGFRLPGSAKAFITPLAKAKTFWARTNPSYEEFYQVGVPLTTLSDYEQGWTFPALFEIDENLWVMLSETGVDGNYVASHLSDIKDGVYFVEFPHADHNLLEDPVYAEVILPFETPWRTITTGSLADVVESTMMQDLVESLYEAKYDYVPGKSTWSWIILKDNNTVYDVQKEYIDFAERLGWEYLLIDALWDTQIGRDKIEELAEYAKNKGVGIMLWYNSNGDWNDAPQTPLNLMNEREVRRAEMEWMRTIGIKGIKVDFFGGDKQVAMKLYDDILRDANDFGIMVNFHGTTLPRGWEVMYPNFLTAEAVKGQEFISFEQEIADRQPGHVATIVFTRNVVGPMDFTPLALNERLGVRNDSGSRRQTTAGFELAMPVVMASGLQHFALVPDNYEEFPEFVFDYLRDVPTTWDDTKLLAGYPGEYAVFARRSADKWYIAGINGENKTKKISFVTPFVDGAEKAFLISDAAGERNKVEYTETGLYRDREFEIELQPHGGFIIIQ